MSDAPWMAAISAPQDGTWFVAARKQLRHWTYYAVQYYPDCEEDGAGELVDTSHWRDAEGRKLSNFDIWMPIPDPKR